MIKKFDDIGIGVDIEENKRFVKLAVDKIFLERVYADKEITYCLTKLNPAQHLAARFAAKEAVIKACNQLGLKKIAHRDIEVVSHGNNSPTVKIKGETKLAIKVSLSHNNSQSLAMVIIIKA